MVLRLYGLPGATGAGRVRVVLEELNAPYEFVVVDIPGANGAQKKPEYKKIHPFGQLPYIDDDGFVLFESRAICRYVALKYGGVGVGKLIPDTADLVETALFEQAASIELSNFDPAVSGLAHENIFKKLQGREPDQQAIQAHRATLEGKLEGYEELLSKSRYIAGDEITLVDLFHLPYGTLLKVQGYDYLESQKHPNIARWWQDISSRPSWRKVIDT